MSPGPHSLEYLVERAAINVLTDKVPSILWLHFEHEATETDGCPVGIVRLERGEPISPTNCFHNSELYLHVVGACDEDHRLIDEAVGNADQLAGQLEAGGEIAIGTVAGWQVARSVADQNLYARTWSTELEAGYYYNN